MKINWQNVLPITIIVVIVGLGFALFWFSPANQAQMAYNDTVLETSTPWSYTDYWQYFEQEANIVPNDEPQVFHLEEGEHELIIRGREPGTLLDKIQVIKVEDATATAAAWTPTPYPICTPVTCLNGTLVCPDGDCLGGCGVVCEAYTPTPIIIEVTPEPVAPLFFVKITGENVNPDQGLMLRECGATLYDACRTLYALISCDYHPELSSCTDLPIPVYDTKYKPYSAAHPADAGWWLNVVCHWSNPGCSDYWIPACLDDGRNFTDLDCSTLDEGN